MRGLVKKTLEALKYEVNSMRGTPEEKEAIKELLNKVKTKITRRDAIDILAEALRLLKRPTVIIYDEVEALFAEMEEMRERRRVSEEPVENLIDLLYDLMVLERERVMKPFMICLAMIEYYWKFIVRRHQDLESGGPKVYKIDLTNRNTISKPMDIYELLKEFIKAYREKEITHPPEGVEENIFDKNIYPFAKDSIEVLYKRMIGQAPREVIPELATILDNAVSMPSINIITGNIIIKMYEPEIALLERCVRYFERITEQIVES